ncbi:MULTISPECIES: DUF4302 domain-containing protein [unclassified Proteiniphilum]|jgi:hypothetical protein|uniref:DUF4302 domain-containing protein n=1 Tax=unclassified Proteiniphilum TaxID=2622718 RepID=UPI00257CD777|nr:MULTISPECIES: DUF4302 domain-containing protein [unclassified Proteiniphilum]
MKTIRNISFLLSIILTFSCNPVEKSLFEDSSANRIEKALESTRVVLTGAENGWLMEYYPSSQQTYGGFNVLAKFSESEVTIASEIAEFDTSEKSTYSLKQSAGPVLSFDTYNEIFHTFSDPNSSKSGLGSNGVGMGGDFEFLIMKATEDSVILKGKKTGNKIVMTPLQSETGWNAYVRELQDASDMMTFKNFEYHVAGQIIPVRVSFRSLIITYTNEEGNEVTVTAPYIQTLTGYKLYQPLTVLGVTVNEFVYGKEGDTEFFTSSDGTDVRLVAVFPPLNQTLVSGDWFFAFSGLGSYGKTYWNYTKVNGLDAIGEVLYYAYLGTHSDGKYAFSFASAYGNSLYGGALHFNYELIDENKVKYSFALTGAGDGVWYYNNALFAYLINPLHGGSSKTFTLTTDNDKEPSWILLTDDSNPDNTIKLYANPVIWPFSN